MVAMQLISIIKNIPFPGFCKRILTQSRLIISKISKKKRLMLQSKLHAVLIQNNPQRIVLYFGIVLYLNSSLHYYYISIFSSQFRYFFPFNCRESNYLLKKPLDILSSSVCVLAHWLQWKQSSHMNRIWIKSI